MHYENLCVVFPIPLTNEIIEQIGFKSEFDSDSEGNKYTDYYLNDLDFNQLNLSKKNDDEGFTVSIDDGINSVYKYCKYLHELQHAIRMTNFAPYADKIQIPN